jgi:hypothetical protein
MPVLHAAPGSKVMNQGRVTKVLEMYGVPRCVEEKSGGFSAQHDWPMQMEWLTEAWIFDPPFGDYWKG